MSDVVPFVRHMLLCDDVRTSPTNPRKVIVYGLVSEIRSPAGETAYPFHHSLSVYLALTGGRGRGEGQIVIVDGDTEETTYVGDKHIVAFGPDPLQVLGVVFRLPSCSFPQGGLYWVEFRYNNAGVARQPLLVR